MAMMTGCQPPEPLPEDLDGLIHFVWSSWDPGESSALAESIGSLNEAVGADELLSVYKGSLSPLSLEQAQLVGVQEDPSSAQGLFVAREFDCDIARLEEVLIAVEQDELYPDSYDAYSRQYTSSLSDWEADETDRLTWSVEYETSLLGSSYSTQVEGGLRRVQGIQSDVVECDTALIGRFAMTEPAEFETGSNQELLLNFQVEIFYERTSGTITHLYGMWQQANLGAGLSTDDEGVQTIILNNMASWDDQTEELCRELR